MYTGGEVDRSGRDERQVVSRVVELDEESVNRQVERSRKVESNSKVVGEFVASLFERSGEVVKVKEDPQELEEGEKGGGRTHIQPQGDNPHDCSEVTIHISCHTEVNKWEEGATEVATPSGPNQVEVLAVIAQQNIPKTNHHFQAIFRMLEETII